MQVFVYTAKDPQGQTITAEVEASTVSDAAKLLTAKQYFPLDIQLKTQKGLSGFSLESLQRISFKDKVLFTRQLATLVKAGLPLAQALHLLTNQIKNPKLLKFVHQVTADVEGGTPLSQALAKRPDLFDRVYIGMVEAGEVSGNLDEVLQQLATQEEKNQQINSKIRSALTYPIVVLVVLIAVLILMITTVLPQVAKMYVDLHASLPFLTQVLLGLAHAVVKFWYLFVLGLVAAAYGIRVYLRTPAGRMLIDTAKLKIPGISVLMKKLYMARFARTLGSLVASGVPVLQALGITGGAMNNAHLEAAVAEVATRVKAGDAISAPVMANPMFLPLVGQMLSVGEQTGTMGDTLNKLASYYEDEVDEAVKNISTLIEPATMILLGGMVAFLVGSILVPIYGLVSKVQ